MTNQRRCDRVTGVGQQPSHEHGAKVTAPWSVRPSGDDFGPRLRVRGATLHFHLMLALEACVQSRCLAAQSKSSVSQLLLHSRSHERRSTKEVLCAEVVYGERGSFDPL